MKTLLKLDPTAPYVYKAVGVVELWEPFVFSGIENIEIVDEGLEAGDSVIYDPSVNSKVYKMAKNPTDKQASEAWHYYGFVLGFTDLRDGFNHRNTRDIPTDACRVAFHEGRVEGEREYFDCLADDEAQARACAQFEADHGQH